MAICCANLSLQPVSGDWYVIVVHSPQGMFDRDHAKARIAVFDTHHRLYDFRHADAIMSRMEAYLLEQWLEIHGLTGDRRPRQVITCRRPAIQFHLPKVRCT